MSIRYRSTRGQAPALDFEGVLLAGLASDGGLYLPESLPQFTADELRAMRGLSYTELATTCLLYTSPSPRDATLSRMPSSA